MSVIRKSKYIVDFNDGSYGQIMSSNGKKIMGSITASNPDAINPSQYTLDEIAETGIFNLRFVQVIQQD